MILAVGRAVRASGEPVNVGAELPLTQAIERGGTPVDVWLIDDPTFEYKPIFAARPVGMSRDR
jgi:hypothetical protein